jgi:hypothetical protein
MLAPEGVVINKYNIVDRMRANREEKYNNSTAAYVHSSNSTPLTRN